MPFNPLNTSNSDSQNFGQATDMFRELYDRFTTEIFKDDSGVRRVLLGKGANGFYGLKVSQPGFDVTSATDAQLGFNSSQNVPKILQSSDFNITGTTLSGGTQNTYTVDVPYNAATLAVYGAGGSPAILAYRNGGYWTGIDSPTFSFGTGGVVLGQVAFFSWTFASTKVTFSVKAVNGTASNWVVPNYAGHVYLLQENGV